MSSSPQNLASIHVRPATAADLDIMTQMQIDLALETENRVLDDRDRVRGSLEKVLSGNVGADIFLAECSCDEEGASEVGAMTMLTYEFSPLRAKRCYWIQGVYTAPKFRGRGLFKQLFAFIRQKALGGTVRLVVDKANVGGIKTYEKLGMYLEPASRVYRFTRAGCEAPRQGWKEEQDEHTSTTPIDSLRAVSLELFKSGKVRAATVEDVDTIVSMQIEAAARDGLPNLNAAVVRSGFQAAIEHKLSEVLAIEHAEGIVASCSVFQEYCDWRAGRIAWISCFAVVASSSLPRAALFAAFVHLLQQRCNEDGSDWVGIRFEIEPMRDSAYPVEHQIVPMVRGDVAGFVMEDDRFMRLEL